MGVARVAGPDAALAIGVWAEALLRVVHTVSGGGEPVRAGCSSRSQANRRGFSPAQAHHGLRAHLLGRPWARPDRRNRQASRYEGVAGLMDVEFVRAQSQAGY